jgi:hypothetical protein
MNINPIKQPDRMMPEVPESLLPDFLHRALAKNNSRRTQVSVFFAGCSRNPKKEKPEASVRHRIYEHYNRKPALPALMKEKRRERLAANY